MALARFLQTKSLGENMPSRSNMFNSRLCNAEIIRLCLSKCGYTHLCGINYKCFSPHYCRCTSFGCTAAIRCGSACHALRWRHNDSDGVSNHQPHDCLLNRLFGRISKKTSKLPVTGLCVGNSPGPVNSPHKGPVTRKMFPFDDVIMGPHNDGVYLGTIRFT